MIGKTVSHYKILEKLGEGGMGVVYKAEDTKLKRTVALKFLPPDMTRDEEAKKRFIKEAQAASALEHSNICNIHEIDETDDGQTFIAMACYEGETLKEKIDRGPFKVEEAVGIAVQIAEGLHEAHEKKIVHRDVKSANVMVTAKGQVKIMDFGLAKLTGQTKLTQTGTTLGTVAYMSPEQTSGGKVDHRTDIWSLGVILYEMITGQLPFKGDYEQAVVYSIMNEEPEPVTSLRTGVPIELERIINRALSKDKKDRYQHADDLLSELNRIKRQLESDTHPIKPERKGNNYIKIAVPLFAAIILTAVGYFVLRPLNVKKGGLLAPEWENSIAVLPFDNLSNDPEQEYFCDGMTEQIISNLSRLPELKVIGRRSMMTYKDSDKRISEIGAELNVAYVLESSIRKSGSRIRVTAQLISSKDDFHVWSKDYDRDYETELFDLQDEVSEAIASSLVQQLSNAEIQEIKTQRPSNPQVWEYYQKGVYFHQSRFLINRRTEDFLASEDMLLKAVQLDPSYVPVVVELGDLYNSALNNLIRYLSEEEKQKYRQLEEEYVEKAFELDPNSAKVLYTKGLIHAGRKEIEEAYKYFQRSVLENPNNAHSYLSLGNFYGGRGLRDMASKCFTKAIMLDPLFLLPYNNLGLNYDYMGDYEQAEAIYKKALAINDEIKVVLMRYPIVLIELNRLDQAEEMMAKFKERYPDDNWNNLFQALLYGKKGEKEKALAIELSTEWRKWWRAVSLKMKDEAIKYLNEDLNNDVKKLEHGNYLGLKRNPSYDFMRSDPRFQEILATYKKIYEENLRKYGDIEL